MSNLQDLRESIKENLDNPSTTVSTVLEFSMDAQDKEFDISSTGSPFVTLMEAGSVFAAAAVDRINSNLGKVYSSLASTREELYLHLSDKDLEHIFAKPSQSLFNVYIQYDSFSTQAITKDGYRSMTLTKGATIKVSETSYVLDRSYEIREINNHVVKVFTEDLEGGGTVVTHSDIIRDTGGLETIVFAINAHQASTVIGTFDVSRSGVFRESVYYTDQFSKIEVYTLINGIWKPVNVSFSERVYDRFHPVIGVKVLDEKVDLYIPPIYTSEGTMGNNILALVYSTKALSNQDILSVTPDRISVTNNDPMLDTQEDTVNAFNRSTYTLLPVSTLSSGREALSDSELHNRIVHNGSSTGNLPITRSQIDTAIRDLGFTGILSRHHSASLFQNWLLTSDILEPSLLTDSDPLSGEELLSAPEAGFIDLSTSMVDLQAIEGTYDNGDQVTIPPEIFFQKTDLGYEAKSNGFSNSIGLLEPHSLSEKMNTSNIYYSPFYYTIKEAEGSIVTEVHDFNHPVVNFISTVTLPANGNFLIITDKAVLINDKGLFKLQVTTRKTASTVAMPESEFFSQLTWLNDDGERVTLLPDTIRKEDDVFITEYSLESTYNLVGTTIEMKGLRKNLDLTLHNANRQITGDMNIVYGTKTPSSTYLDNSIDRYIYKTNTNEVRVGLSLERLNVTLGKRLDNLWTNSRLLEHKTQFETYPEDVPLKYTFTSIPISSTSPSPFTIKDNCDIAFNDPVKEGDIVYDADGNIVYEHRKGEVVFDVGGNPVVLSVLKRKIGIEVFALHSMAYYSLEEAKTYIDKIITDLVNKSTYAIKPLLEKVLGHTDLYFYPLNGIGTAEVAPVSGFTGKIDKAQSLKIDIHVDDRSYLESVENKKRVRRSIIQTIDAELRKGNLTPLGLTSSIRDILPSDLGNIIISGLGGDSGRTLIRLTDAKDRLFINKRVVPGTNNTIHLEDDIEIIYHYTNI